MLQHALIQRIDARDRAWYLRLVLAESAPTMTLNFWKMLTHVGGVTASIIIAFVPLGFAEDAYKIAAVQAAWTLGISHLIVQVMDVHGKLNKTHKNILTLFLKLLRN